jgi:hypothetical protein
MRLLHRPSARAPHLSVWKLNSMESVTLWDLDRSARKGDLRVAQGGACGQAGVRGSTAGGDADQRQRMGRGSSFWRLKQAHADTDTGAGVTQNT